ncbi:MAG: peptidase T [Marinifilaceae bacterium]|nr:peptidase T [Marinifilaceae bacterium]
MRQKIVNRFLKYTTYDTQSDPKSNTTPSTHSQMVFAKLLYDELINMGLSHVELDNHGYLMATLPSNTDEKLDTIGFIAHMDTSPDYRSDNVSAQIIKDYPGGDITLNANKEIIMSVEDFPELNNYIGQDLICTNGLSLLGADDKAGIAEIISAIEYLIDNPEIKHGDIKIGFTPDEEIGRGADMFNCTKFKADYAFTLDGGEIGELQYENFNAAYAKISFVGRNVHPGTAKGKMINSINMANRFLSYLPSKEVPEHTENYEGFYHIVSFEGSVENTSIELIVRDFSKTSYEDRKQNLISLCKQIEREFEKSEVNIEMHDQYFNMSEKIKPVSHIVDLAAQTMKDIGVEPKIIPIRGGTDGSRLSFMGLPCPNIFTGGHNFHGKYEYIPIPSMLKASEFIVNIVQKLPKK